MQLAETPTYPMQVKCRREQWRIIRDADGLPMVAKEISETYSKLRGEVYPYVTCPKFADVEDDVVVATDGSLKDSNGGAAYVINSIRTPGTLKSVLPVDGNKIHLTMCRIDLVGILGELLTLRAILQEQGRIWKHLSGTLWCNNKGAVTKFNQLEDAVPFSLTLMFYRS